MHITNYKNKTSVAGKISKFTIIFSDNEKCSVVAKELELLANDDWVRIWHAFEGKKAKQLLSNAIDGLIIFLSCKSDKNTITGEFFSLDRENDAEILTYYVQEAQNDAFVDVKAVTIAA